MEQATATATATATRRVIGCKRMDGGANCPVTGTCKGCISAIYEPDANHPATSDDVLMNILRNARNYGNFSFGEWAHLNIVLRNHGIEEREFGDDEFNRAGLVRGDWEKMVRKAEEQAAKKLDTGKHLVAVMIKAALDAASELDALKSAAAIDPHDAPISAEERDRLQQVVVPTSRADHAGHISTRQGCRPACFAGGVR